MNASEFSNEFDILYNNITSNQAPGLNEYEKSVFLTKAQNQILLSYLLPLSNKLQEGYDGSAKRLVDFSKLTVLESLVAYNFFEKNTTLKILWLNDRNVSLSVEVGYEGEGNSHLLLMSSDDQYPLILANDFKVDRVYNAVTFTVEKVERTGTIVKADGSNLLLYFICTTYDWMLENGEVKEGKQTTSSIKLHILPPSSLSLEEKEALVLRTTLEMYENIPTINSKGMVFDSPSNEILAILNEQILCKRKAPATLTVVPIDFNEYNRLMSKPYKFPLKNLAWRLLHSLGLTTYYEIISPYNKNITSYIIRYVKKPMPIIISDTLEELGLTIEGYKGTENFYSDGVCCEAPETLHEPILQRAVELAKAAYIGDLNSQVGLGVNSLTEVGMITLSR